MNTKKLLLAWLATFVVTFVLAGLWHVVLLGDFYRTNDVALARAEQNMLFVALGQLILAFLMAFAYPIGYKGGSAVRKLDRRRFYVSTSCIVSPFHFWLWLYDCAFLESAKGWRDF